MWSLPDDFGLPAVPEKMHAFALSTQGELAAGGTDGHVKVLRIPDGAKMLDLDFGKSGGYIALSPDGELLAISDYSRNRIRFYKVLAPCGPSTKIGRCTMIGPKAIVRKTTLRRSLVVVSALIAVLVVIVWVRMNSALTAEERSVAGSWIINQMPGRTGVYTFTTDRQFFASDLNSSGVPIDEDPPAPGEPRSCRTTRCSFAAPREARSGSTICFPGSTRI